MKNFSILERYSQSQILFLGGSGLLGTTFQKYLAGIQYPTSSECNIENYQQMVAYFSSRDIKLVFHAAAYTSPPAVDGDPVRALMANIVGTAHIVRVCMAHNTKIIYLSTDYVFKGDRGMYVEDDPVLPQNKYAWSKLGGECAVRMHDNHLIIRTSFGPDVFAHKKAFVDQWTSRETATVIAQKIIFLSGLDITGTIHVGGDRRSVYEYARSTHPSHTLGTLLRKDVLFSVPRDTSLDCARSQRLLQGH